MNIQPKPASSDQKGFSLIELLTVVAIIGIIATIALPAYNDYVTRGKLTEAFTNLSDLRVKLEQFYQDNRVYGTPDGAGNCGKDAGGTVRVTIPPSGTKYFTYTCTVANTGQSYILTGTGVTGQGAGGFTYTIDQTNAKATPGLPPGWNYPSGQTSATSTCWVRSKDGSC